ncbi:Oligoribonuclease (3'-_5' exoribonuclease) [Bifidobacterium actinocoloniiforme DSM 22766]|uniref:Oligoribonuclease (3'->5' exoribonuclease) n=1 Tax=Bifidobacterium actinocoloniiforme DSM 22766 TaxID=1437605 RepID=A0A086YZW2_9BIFI|nr:hypothetical protein [Bifidobacterium actinocoloniiforme]AKV55095.1 hypothetical protein AB656_01175 [Bifidobacterium actinocoloniiforme DSM 22766]KFI39812.1 Oligoribonuclease (3'->5' exoribonuclease) [Bifidobacterium actinocoloniiforme DSM 22766]
MSEHEQSARPDRLLWIDIETGGLDPLTNPILEVEMRITDLRGSSETLDSDHWIVDPEGGKASTIDPWALEHHSRNGLLDAVRTEGMSRAGTMGSIYGFLGTYSKDFVLHPAGSSVHFDLDFLTTQHQLIPGLLSHQWLDITSLRLALRTINPALLDDISSRSPKTDHRTKHCLDRDLAEYRMMLAAFNPAMPADPWDGGRR